MKTFIEKGSEMIQRWKTVFPETVVSLLLFITLKMWFSTKNILLPPFLTLLFITKKKQDFHLLELIRTYIWFFIICLCSYFATTTAVLCLMMNLLVPFFLVFLFTSKFNPKAYFIYGMEFVMLQLVPIQLQELPIRMLAMLYGCTVLTIALYINAIIMRRKRNFNEVRKGLYDISILLNGLCTNDDKKDVQHSLTNVLHQMNQLIYNTRNLSYLTDGYGKVNFLFMIIFQRIQYFTSYFNLVKWTQQDRVYLYKLSEVLKDMCTLLYTDHHLQCVNALQQLKKTYTLYDQAAQEALDEIIDILLYTLKNMETIRLYKHEKTWKIPKTTRKIQNLFSFFKMDVFHTRFALRLSIVLCFGFTFYKVTHLEHAYWFPLSAFFMLMPYAEESKQKIEGRIRGTIVGVCISFILMSYFQSEMAHFIIMIVLTCFMYYVPPTSWLMPMYTTCYAMVFATMSLQLEKALMLRILYVAIAAIISWLATYYLLPNTAEMQFKQSVHTLFDIDVEMIKTIRKAYHQEFDKNLLRDLIIHSHLIANEIQVYMSNHMSEEEKQFYSQLLPINRQLVSEIEQLSHYLHKRKPYSHQKHDFMELIFMNFEDIIEEIRYSYTSNELTPVTAVHIDASLLKELDDTVYFHSLAMNCMNTLQHLANLKESYVVKA